MRIQMRKSGIILLSIISSISFAHAELTVKNENIPLEILSPKLGMMGSSKNQPALFYFPEEGKTVTHSLTGNYFDFMIMPTGRQGVRCWLNKEDRSETPWEQRKGMDISNNSNTEIIVKWVEGEEQLQCQITQQPK